jgi:PAS domain-containing protein
VVSAEILVHDALDGAALLALSALGEQEVARQAQAELETERGLLDALFRTAPIGFAFLDRDLRYVRINERLAEINGRRPAARSAATDRGGTASRGSL